MSRFLLFAGDNYYPGGGVVDFKGMFETIEAAKEEHAKHVRNFRKDGLQWEHCDYDSGWEWAHIAKLSDSGLEIITEFGHGNGLDMDSRKLKWRGQ